MPKAWIPRTEILRKQITQEEERLDFTRYSAGEDFWDFEAPDEEPRQGEAWWQKGMRYALIPPEAVGKVQFGTQLEVEEFRKEQEGKPLWETLKAGFQRREPVVTREEIARQYAELPLWKQLAYEAPFWATTIAAPTATALRARLATTAARGGIKGGIAAGTRVALAPIAGVERAMGVGLHYGIGVPLTYGGRAVAIPIRKAFETALDRGLARWLSQQGHSGVYANRIVEYFLKKNNAWLVRQADESLKRQLARHAGMRHPTETIARAAAGDTIKQAEPMLLQASKEVGKVPPTEALAVKPPVASIEGSLYRADLKLLVETPAGKTVRNSVITDADFTLAKSRLANFENGQILIDVGGNEWIYMLSKGGAGSPNTVFRTETAGIVKASGNEGLNLIARSKEGGNFYTEVAPTVEPALPIGITQPQIDQIYKLATEKALVTSAGQLKPQLRRLIIPMTGRQGTKLSTKALIADLNAEEVNTVIEALTRLPEPVTRGRVKIPPRIPITTAVVPENYFNLKFGEPTPIRLLTSQTYYSQKLGVKPLVEPLELTKQRFDLEVNALINAKNRKIAEINKLGKTSATEIASAKLKNIPTKAVARMRDLLNKYENAPADLTLKEAELFGWFRNVSRMIIRGENQVRELLGMELIPYRKGYVRHISEPLVQEIIYGGYPLPEALKYWSQKIVGKKIFNSMEMQRTLARDLEEYFTKDLSYATEAMIWTGLKEIHLAQPLQAFSEQMGAFTKDVPLYKHLPAEEYAKVKDIAVLPASTRQWVTDYVNQVIKGQQTHLDAEVNRLVTQSGLGGLINKALKPFGRTVGRMPMTRMSSFAGRAMILSVMTPRLGLVKMIIRNLFQHTQDMALYDIKSMLKAYYPAKGTLKELLNESLFLKGYTGFEELPAELMGKIEKLALKPYGASAVFNAKMGMKTAYYDTLPYFTNPKYRELGWADPQRTYTESKDFLYPNERKRLLQEMEFGAGVTQYSYIGMGMPELFRHKVLKPITRLQSWWMNHFFKFHREAMHRALKGETGYGAKIPWSKRLNYLKYIILGGALLTSMGYERSFMLGVLPYNLSPVGQFMIGLYNYSIADSDWKRAKAKSAIFNSWRAFVPGSLAWKEFMDVWNGERPLRSIFFYEAKEKLPPHPPTWSIPGVRERVKQTEPSGNGFWEFQSPK